MKSSHRPWNLASVSQMFPPLIPDMPHLSPLFRIASFLSIRNIPSTDESGYGDMLYAYELQCCGRRMLTKGERAHLLDNFLRSVLRISSRVVLSTNSVKAGCSSGTSGQFSQETSRPSWAAGPPHGGACLGEGNWNFEETRQCMYSHLTQWQ